VVQFAFSYSYVRKREWGGRPTYFDQPGIYRAELKKHLLRDRSLQSNAEGQIPVKEVGAWVVSAIKTNGVEVLLRSDVPMIAVNSWEYFAVPKSREKYRAALAQIQGKPVYSLALTEDLESSLSSLKQRGLEVRKVSPVEVGFFSDYIRLHMSLIEIAVPDRSNPVRRPKDYPEVTEATGPLPDDAFFAGISSPTTPATMRPGEKVTLNLLIQNQSIRVWPARGKADGKHFITVANSWLDKETGRLITNTDARTRLERDLWPEDTAQIPLTIKAPVTPGEYILELDMVEEGVTWFKDRGSEPLRIAIRVE